MRSFVFKTKVKWEENKKGEIWSSKTPRIKISTPPEFKGPEGFWSPEELFLASVNTCIMTTFLYFKDKFSFHLFSYESEIEGAVSFKEGKLSFTSITIYPRIKVKKGEISRAKSAMKKTEEYCLISNSIRPKVKVITDIQEGG
ncbi:MAG: OsmC family peroxiredoxin [Caldiserica bacterium]|nr:OsmC family peroxiredoxin [Caldisericota bacterium]